MSNNVNFTVYLKLLATAVVSALSHEFSFCPMTMVHKLR